MRKWLVKLAAAYPQYVKMGEGCRWPLTPDSIKSLNYLAELELITMDDGYFRGGIAATKITAKGLDFLADDSGYSAILGTVTVRLHTDTLKALIKAHIESSDMPQSDKKRYVDHLRDLPAETTKHLLLKLVDAGCQNWPQVFPLLQSILGC